MSHMQPHVQHVAPNGQPIDNRQPPKPWWLWLALGIPFVIVIFIFGALTNKDDDGSEDAAPEPVIVETVQSEPKDTTKQTVDPVGVEILDMSTDETSFISATYPVKDTWTSGGVIRNIQDGCHQAIQTVQTEVDNWWDYDIIQCMGMADWVDGTAVAGSANFTGPDLSEVALPTVTGADLWDLAYHTHLMDGLTN